MLLPDESSSGIDFDLLSPKKQYTTTACIFAAVNFCRELINSFVRSAAFKRINKDETQLTQLHEDYRTKVTEKFKALVELEEELELCAKKCYQFAPPGMPVLQIPREIKDLQSGKMDNEYAEYDDSDEMLLSKMTTEEKKAYAEIKKAKKRKLAAKLKSKQKAIKLKAKYEAQLAKITQSALIPLNTDVCLALGFPELRIARSAETSSQDLITSLGASELRKLQVGGRLTTLLLEELNKSLQFFLTKNSKKVPFMNRSTKHQAPETMNVSNNPYNNDNLRISNKNGSQPNTTKFDFLNVIISKDVFVSIHEHLAAIAEIRSASSNEGHDEEEILSCARLLLQCITTLFKTEDLFYDSTGRGYLEMIVKQLSHGEHISIHTYKPLSSILELVQHTSRLFDLLEEIADGGDTNDLSFVMEGVTCLKSVLIRITSILKRLGEKQNENKSVQSMKLKISKLCLRLLQREWHQDTKFNKGNVGLLVTMYLEYGSISLKSLNEEDTFQAENFGGMKNIKTIVEMLRELSNTAGCKGPLESYPTCVNTTFGYFLSSSLSALSKELISLFQSPIAQSDNCDQNRLEVLQTLVSYLNQMSGIIKRNPPLAKKNYLLTQVKGGSRFIDVFVKYALPFLGNMFDTYEEKVIKIINDTQMATRELSFIIAHGKKTRDANLVKEAPKAKKIFEMFKHHLRSMMRENGVLDAFNGGPSYAMNGDDGSVESNSFKEDSSRGSRSSEESDTETDDNDSDDDSS